jgi:hypothetical protein
MATASIFTVTRQALCNRRLPLLPTSRLVSINPERTMASQNIEAQAGELLLRQFIHRQFIRISCDEISTVG